jgi:hypothetical protein
MGGGEGGEGEGKGGRGSQNFARKTKHRQKIKSRTGIGLEEGERKRHVICSVDTVLQPHCLSDCIPRDGAVQGLYINPVHYLVNIMYQLFIFIMHYSMHIPLWCSQTQVLEPKQ